MKWSDRDELLFAKLAALFRIELQTVQQELAAWVATMRTKELGNHQLGVAVAQLQSDMRALITLVVGTPSGEQKEQILAVVEAGHEVDRREAEASKKPGKVLAFKKRKKKPRLKPGGNDAA